jgi:hypothetical protein
VLNTISYIEYSTALNRRFCKSERFIR